jgi:putative transcriptional regulator
MKTALPTSAKNAASPLLAALHDTATDLHKAGFMDLKSLSEYDALCLADEVCEAEDIVTLLSQL